METMNDEDLSVIDNTTHKESKLPSREIHHYDEVIDAVVKASCLISYKDVLLTDSLIQLGDVPDSGEANLPSDVAIRDDFATPPSKYNENKKIPKLKKHGSSGSVQKLGNLVPKSLKFSAINRIGKLQAEKKKKQLNNDLLHDDDESVRQAESTKDEAELHLLRLQRDRIENGTWVKCTNCEKWRYLASVADPQEVHVAWVCSMNSDPSFASCEIDELLPPAAEEQMMIYGTYGAGSLVWAQLEGFPWWPAMVDDDPDYEQFYWLNDFSDIPTYYNVVFFDSDPVSRAWIPVASLAPFNVHENHKFTETKINGVSYRKRLVKAKKDAIRASKMDLKRRLKEFSFVARYKGKLYDQDMKKTKRNKLNLETFHISTNSRVSSKSTQDHKLCKKPYFESSDSENEDELTTSSLTSNEHFTSPESISSADMVSPRLTKKMKIIPSKIKENSEKANLISNITSQSINLNNNTDSVQKKIKQKSHKVTTKMIKHEHTNADGIIKVSKTKKRPGIMETTKKDKLKILDGEKISTMSEKNTAVKKNENTTMSIKKNKVQKSCLTNIKNESVIEICEKSIAVIPPKSCNNTEGKKTGSKKELGSIQVSEGKTNVKISKWKKENFVKKPKLNTGKKFSAPVLKTNNESTNTTAALSNITDKKAEEQNKSGKKRKLMLHFKAPVLKQENQENETKKYKNCEAKQASIDSTTGNVQKNSPLHKTETSHFHIELDADLLPMASPDDIQPPSSPLFEVDE